MFGWHVKQKQWFQLAGKTGLACLAASSILPHFASAASVSSSVSILGQQFATDAGPSSRVDYTAHFRSEESLLTENAPLYDGQNTPRRELHFYSFFETDKPGDRSWDIDSAVIRVSPAPNSHFWFGRNHPLKEGFESNRVLPTGAIGANWVQDQSNALEPRVAGWVGTGMHIKSASSGFFATGAFSPVFLPNFGPGVDFSEKIDTTGTRFAHLPPAYITINDQPVALRYKIIADTKSIVLQNQYFLSAGHESKNLRLTIMHWSAPAPNPQTSAVGMLRADRNDVNALVTATATFPRQNFLGTQFSLLQIASNFEAVYEKESGNLTVSGSVKPFRFFEAGYTDTLLQQTDISSSGTSAVSSPLYAKRLAWGELNGSMFKETIFPSLRIEQHLSEIESGRWVHAAVTYKTDEQFRVFASASILTGTDFAYFGNWRDLDSVAMGVRYQW